MWTCWKESCIDLLCREGTPRAIYLELHILRYVCSRRSFPPNISRGHLVLSITSTGAWLQTLATHISHDLPCAGDTAIGSSAAYVVRVNAVCLRLNPYL
jgi:hypothetical protein